METILLVEDEEPVLEVVRNLLGLNRYLVIEAHDGYQALAICTDYSDVIHLMITTTVVLSSPPAWLAKTTSSSEAI